MNLTATVIVATRNRPRDLPPLLEALERTQTGAIAEVILVDDASAVPVGRLPLLSAAFPLRVIRNDVQQGASASRNIAARQARGDVLAFLDDDARPLPDWCHVLSLSLTPERAAITGRVLPFDEGVVSRARQYRYERRYAAQVPARPVDFFAGGNSAVRTDLFRAAGGFPETGTGSDNGLVPALRRRGTAVHFVPELRIAHRNGKGFVTALRESWRSGRTAGGRAAPLQELRRAATAAAAQPWGVDVAAASTNTVLQTAHSLARCTAAAGREKAR